MKYSLPIIFPIFTLFLGGLTGIYVKDRAHKKVEPPQKITLAGLGSVTGNKFQLSAVIQETCGVTVLKSDSSHAPLLAAIQEAGKKVSEIMSLPDSPAREKRRINEVSALFENALRLELNSHPDLTCDFPKTQSGETQRSGYPDLRVEHLPTGTIAYLDPKLFEAKSIKSSFRTFYYEPSSTNSKVTEDALHLLIGFPHDGNSRQWTFATPKLVDLSNLTVKLKTEFSASNKDIYAQ